MEATAEIQAAARRVADENKMLRILLRQEGVDDCVTEYVLVRGVRDGVGGGYNGQPAKRLESLFDTLYVVRTLDVVEKIVAVVQKSGEY